MRRDKTAIVNPTTVLFTGCLAVFYLALAVSWRMPDLAWWQYAGLFALQFFIVFLAFTSIHDGVHRAISSRRWLNEAFLHAHWAIFLNSPFLFRKVHLAHHVHTNKDNDPDHWTAAPTLGMRWAKSMALLFNYYFYAFRHFRNQRWVKFHLVMSPLAPVILGAIALYFGKLPLFLWGWWLPVMVGIGVLGFANTSWPHHPAQETDRYKNTRIIYVPRWLQMIMGNQNLHLVHHLQPTIPWYDYPAYWAEHEQEIVEKGASVTSYTKRAKPY